MNPSTSMPPDSLPTNPSPRTSTTKSPAALVAQAAWSLVHQPAVLSTGNRQFSVNRRPLADFYFVAITEALASVINRNVAFSWEKPAKTVLGAFGLMLNGGGMRTLFTLDTDACRALVEPLTTDLANLRGAGSLSDTECGLLEFISLGILDLISEKYAQKISALKNLSLPPSSRPVLVP